MSQPTALQPTAQALDTLVSLVGKVNATPVLGRTAGRLLLHGLETNHGSYARAGQGSDALIKFREVAEGSEFGPEYPRADFNTLVALPWVESAVTPWSQPTAA